MVNFNKKEGHMGFDRKEYMRKYMEKKRKQAKNVNEQAAEVVLQNAVAIYGQLEVTPRYTMTPEEKKEYKKIEESIHDAISLQVNPQFYASSPTDTSSPPDDYILEPSIDEAVPLPDEPPITDYLEIQVEELKKKVDELSLRLDGMAKKFYDLLTRAELILGPMPPSADIPPDEKPARMYGISSPFTYERPFFDNSFPKPGKKKA
jgi:hypothetical protein